MDVTEMDLSNFLEREEQAEYHKKLAQEAEAFLLSCGKKPLEVFRMEKFVPTPQTDKFGKFHEGDSYVVCKNNDEDYQIHYWHGKEATADEMGCSAFFSVQLSARLPKKSSHHLEEQSYESELFQSYFDSVQYLPGGIESGFRETKKDYSPKLFQCKGTRYPRIFNVPVEANSINEGDVFILDCPREGEDVDDILYFWPGNQCNVTEKMKGLQVTDSINRDEKHYRADIRYPRETDEVDAEFWAVLGGKPGTINPPTSDDISEADADQDQFYKFYHISNATGKLMCSEVTERPLKKDHLDTKDTFILELHKQIYIWIGKEADVEEKKAALQIGQGFLKEKKKPPGTRVTRIVENGEDTHFRSFFDGYYGTKQAEVPKQDMEKMAAAKRTVTDNLLAELGDYNVKVYLCKDGTPQELPKADHGHFFQDNVYAVDVKGAKHRYIVQWFGPRMAADKVSEHRSYLDILTDYTFIPSEISRISMMQGHEDDTLLTFFPDGFVCHDGEKCDLADQIAKLKADGGLYRVQGPFGEKPQAIQQDNVVASNLNSGESFVVIAKGGDKCWAWLGSDSDNDEKEYAKKLCGTLCPGGAMTAIDEGSETDDFWEALGGKAEYANFKKLGIPPGFQGRLFDMRFSEAKGGAFWMAEVPNFSQMDLHADGIFILDAFKTIYMWIGGRANKFLKSNANKKVEMYIANMKDRSPADVQVCQLDPCGEPMVFRSFFPEWEEEVAQVWLQPDPYTARQQAIAKEREEHMKKYAPKKEEMKTLDVNTTTFDIEVLKTSLPDGVSPAMKEKYLSDEQFEAAFKMKKDDFYVLKQWRQQKLKKEAGLF